MEHDARHARAPNSRAVLATVGAQRARMVDTVVAVPLGALTAPPAALARAALARHAAMATTRIRRAQPHASVARRVNLPPQDVDLAQAVDRANSATRMEPARAKNAETICRGEVVQCMPHTAVAPQTKHVQFVLDSCNQTMTARLVSVNLVLTTRQPQHAQRALWDDTMRTLDNHHARTAHLASMAKTQARLVSGNARRAVLESMPPVQLMVARVVLTASIQQVPPTASATAAIQPERAVAVTGCTMASPNMGKVQRLAQMEEPCVEHGT